MSKKLQKSQTKKGGKSSDGAGKDRPEKDKTSKDDGEKKDVSVATYVLAEDEKAQLRRRVAQAKALAANDVRALKLPSFRTKAKLLAKTYWVSFAGTAVLQTQSVVRNQVGSRVHRTGRTEFHTGLGCRRNAGSHGAWRGRDETRLCHRKRT